VSVSEASYVLADTAHDAEATRLELLERIVDPSTMHRLHQIGVSAGWRCLEAGAGHGSVTRWLASQVGPGGGVVCVDLDPRFLVDLPANVEVRAGDIRGIPLEPATYDLVHCRALLAHVPDPGGVLARLVAAARPGGIVLVEEPDYGLTEFGGHPDALWHTELVQRILRDTAAAGAMNACLGRSVPALLAGAGLEVLGGGVDGSLARFGEDAYELHRLSFEATSPTLLRLGYLTQDELVRSRAVLACPTVVFPAITWVAAWGRRP
jgi:SAM-dependent methyltransferase